MIKNADGAHVQKFVIFVDTNILRASAESAVPTTHFIDSWSKMAIPGDARLVIPDIALEELVRQKTKANVDDYAHCVKKLKAMKPVLGIDIQEKNEDEIKQKTREILTQTILVLPYASIQETNYLKITPDHIRWFVNASVWRRPPFEEGKEGAGFRDSIILENFKQCHNENIHENFIMLTNDNGLFEATSAFRKNNDNVEVFRSVNECDQYLTAARSSMGATFLHKVLVRVEDIVKSDEFFKEMMNFLTHKFSLSPGNLFYDKSNPARGFLSLLGNAYSFLEGPYLTGKETKFLGIVGKTKFHWSTQVIIVTIYERQKTLLGVNDALNDKKIRLIVADVEWEATVDENFTFTGIRFLNADRFAESLETYHQEGENDAYKDTWSKLYDIANYQE